MYGPPWLEVCEKKKIIETISSCSVVVYIQQIAAEIEVLNLLNPSA
jgi:hypothetical protein